jgi:hypothetical protein
MDGRTAGSALDESVRIQYSRSAGTMTRLPRIAPAFSVGRRLALLVLAASALVGLPLFLLFPVGHGPWTAARGGGQLRPLSAPLLVGASPRTRFVSLNAGDTIDFSPGPVAIPRSAQILRRVGRSMSYRAVPPGGHALVTLGRGRAQRTVSVLVSPFPSYQVSRDDLDWYKSQYGTGIANCGPALVSMAILWARGLDTTVDQIREEIGWPYDDGATSYDDLRGSLARHGVRFSSPFLTANRELYSLLDKGHIAFLLIQSGLIDTTPGNPAANMVGRYYDDDEGHYVIVKGYSLDHRYLVVYDPYPVDWESNSLRYGDGITQIGKDRYYPADQVFAALKTREVIEIYPGT